MRVAALILVVALVVLASVEAKKVVAGEAGSFIVVEVLLPFPCL
jgi:hypothetical protein